MNILTFINTRLVDFVPQINSTADQTTMHKLQFVVAALSQHNIKCNYDAPGKAYTRLLLHSSRYNTRNYALASECNGLILDYTDYSVICFAPELANANYNIASLHANFKCYQVYWAQNGTVINLSWQTNRFTNKSAWRISTARGIDVTDMYCPGQTKVTYQAALDAAMRDRITYTALDPQTTYTFGITHPDTHFRAAVDMWFVSSYRTFRQFDTVLPLKNHHTTDFESFEDLQKNVSADFDINYPTWGVVMRSTNVAVTGCNSTIIIESRLMNAVRTLVYDRKLEEKAVVLGMQKSEYVFYMCMLNPALYDVHHRLFPEQSNRMTTSVAELENVAQKIVNTKDKSRTVDYFRTHISTVRDVRKMSAADVVEFIKLPDYISVWHSHFTTLMN